MIPVVMKWDNIFVLYTEALIQLTNKNMFNKFKILIIRNSA